MGKADSTIIAIGGGDLASAKEILDEIIKLAQRASEPRVVIATVATNQPEEAVTKYNSIFRRMGIRHVESVDVSQRKSAFSDNSLRKIERADLLYFTGGDQLNITSLIGGTPLHNLIHQRWSEGVVIAGTSAGAAMMSTSMITSGGSDSPPRVGGVEIAPGMDLIPGTIIDSHFTQRGRHGRLLTAVAHYPQSVGLGIDEETAIVSRNSEFRVIGKGAVTIIDGSQMKYSDLPYKTKKALVGMFGVCVHVLPAGYGYNYKTREPDAPKMKKLAGANGDL